MATASNYSPAAISAMISIGSITPVTIANVAGSIEAGGTGAAAGGWDTAGHRDTSITTMTEFKTVINNILTQLAAAGIPITIT